MRRTRSTPGSLAKDAVRGNRPMPDPPLARPGGLQARRAGSNGSACTPLERLAKRSASASWVGTGCTGATASAISSRRGIAPQWASLRPCSPTRRGAAVARSLRRGAAAGDPGECVPSSPRHVYGIRSVSAGLVDAGSLLEVAPRWARSVLTGFARSEGRPVGLDRQSAPLPWRRARQRVLPEGRPLRRDLRSLRRATGRSRRHPRLHARHAAGAGGCDSARGDARSRLRGGDRAAGDRRSAQGLRRGRDRRPRSSIAASWPPPRTRSPAERLSRPCMRKSTWGRGSRLRAGSSTR